MPTYITMMSKTVKKYLIPHKGNDHKPHLLRKESVIALAVIIVFLFTATSLLQYTLSTTKAGSLWALIISSVLIDLANQDREVTDGSLPTLTVNPLLVEAAQQKANDMVEKSYFAHTSPEGISPWYFISNTGYQFSFAGENLAVNFSDSDEVEQAWMNSPGHRANILNGNFTEIGIATAQGVYKGNQTTFVVQMFGRPAESPTIVALESTGEEALPEITEEAINEAPVTEVETILVAGARINEEIADVEPPVASKDMFIAVKNVEPKAIEPRLTAAGTSSFISFIERVLSSPRLILNLSYTALAALIFGVLILMIVIEVRKQHPLHISYAVFLLALITVLLYANSALLFGEVLIV